MDAGFNGRLIRIGTRGSALARWQTDHVAALLKAAHPNLTVETQVIATRGEKILDQPLAKIGGKGLFTEELEAALRGGEIDLAVHSLKDLPTDSPDDLIIGAIPQREDPADVLISRAGYTLATLPQGATVGTSSVRRTAQLLHLRRDLGILDIRGNIDTRIRKALDPEGSYDAILLAYAGVARLGKLDVVTQKLSLDEMLPAPGQGALAVQCRNEPEMSNLLLPIQHAPSMYATTAERAFLAGLGGGCSLPIAAYGEVTDHNLRLRGRVVSANGAQVIEANIEGRAENAETLGYGLADTVLARGAANLLESLD